jgi:hypothetical protein
LGQPGALANDADTAVAFNGSSGKVDVPQQAALNVGDRFTIEAWVKRGSIGGSNNQVIAAKQSGSWVLLFNSSNQLVLRKAAVADVAASTVTVADTTQWHYVAATKDGATVKLFVDGAEVTGAVTNQTMVDNTQALAIGQSSGTAFFNGTIDEVALYNVALTAAQITNHYGGGVSGPASSAPPTITGTTQDGQTLSADHGTWTGTAPLTYAYQWSRCTQVGTPCVDIANATGSTYTIGHTDVGATLRVAVTASNAHGSTTAVSAVSAIVSAPPAAAGDPVIAAAGDIACDPNDSRFNSGLGMQYSCQQMATSDLLLNAPYSAVLALGDNQYTCGGYNAFLQSYGPSWGRVLGITHPVPGNHEYVTSGGTDCDFSGQAAGYFQYFGSAAGEPGKGYYSYDLGSWHLLALNSNCLEIGGCLAGSPEETWLKADLAAHASQCTLAYWHHPRFTSSAVGETTDVAGFWDDLYSAGADLILNGHTHGYERFAPQDPQRQYDPAAGLRELVVGTGGEDFQALGSAKPLTELRQPDTFGVLQLTLHPSSYDWRFIPVAGSTFSDSGSGFCH